MKRAPRPAVQIPLESALAWRLSAARRVRHARRAGRRGFANLQDCAVRLALLVAAWPLAACSDITVEPAAAGGKSAQLSTAPTPNATVTRYDAVTCDQSLDYPNLLGCTGLYSDWAQGTISGSVLSYQPGFSAWADGAKKQWYVLLPKGASIDVSDPNEWVFPIGTKFWKEIQFEVAGTWRPIETQFLWKVANDQWVRATYAWTATGRNAAEVVEGATNVLGTPYEIASQSQCPTCHKGSADYVLGFEGVLLANGATKGVTYSSLLQGGLLRTRNGAAVAPASPNLQIPGSPIEVSALGYLHANCGVSCHSGAARADGTQSKLALRLNIDSGGSLPAHAMDTPIAANTLNVGIVGAVPAPGESSVAAPGVLPGSFSNGCRILPGVAAQSVLSYRLGSRDATPATTLQMPSVGTHVVDADGLYAVEAWIGSMTPENGYPSPVDGLCIPPF